MLFSIVNDPVISGNELNRDLKVINQYAYQWKMEFNPDPKHETKELLFFCKKNNPNHPPLFFNVTVVSTVNEQKHFGLYLTQNLLLKDTSMKKSLRQTKYCGHKIFFEILTRYYLSRRSLKVKLTQDVTLKSLMDNVERTQFQASILLVVART